MQKVRTGAGENAREEQEAKVLGHAGEDHAQRPHGQAQAWHPPVTGQPSAMHTHGQSYQPPNSTTNPPARRCSMCMRR